LLKISQRPGTQRSSNPDEIASIQASFLQQAKVLDPKISFEQGTITSITVKQFPDAADPQEKCYQAIVISRRTIKDIGVSETSEDATISIYENADGPIGITLGLRPSTVRHPHQSPLTIRAEKSFTIRATMVETDCDDQDVLMRVYDGLWKRTSLDKYTSR